LVWLNINRNRLLTPKGAKALQGGEKKKRGK